MECKFKIYVYISPVNRCFILTMWNVNHLIQVIFFVSIQGFILTMWNVNESLHICRGSPNSCFILTMWNVNETVAAFVTLDDAQVLY